MISYFKEPILYNGQFAGVVIDNRDPKKMGRVKVRIKNINDKINSELLPFYQCAKGVNMTFNNSNSIPPVNSEVIVQFTSNDIYNGEVIKSLSNKPSVKKG